MALFTGELVVFGLNLFGVIRVGAHDLVWVGVILLAYRVPFLWAWYTRQKHIDLLYGLVSGGVVVRNLLLLMSFASYATRRGGVRILPSGDMYVGDSAISLFGLSALIVATVLRTAAVGWVMVGDKSKMPAGKSAWPVVTLSLPIIIYLGLSVSEGIPKLFFSLIYDLMVFYGYGIFF